MGYLIEFRPAARRALDELSAEDRSRISKAIDKLRVDPYGPGCKKLKGTDFWRIRAGDYRVVYTPFKTELVVVVIRIGHRREVYR